MSARIFPCFRCPLRKGCDERNELLRLAAAATGAVSIRFRCEKLKMALRIGRRIEISTPAVTNVDRDDGSVTISHQPVPATITRLAAGYAFGSVIDPGYAEDRFRFRRNQHHYRIIRFLDEPDAEVCQGGAVVREGRCDSPNGCFCRDEA